jgi:hypothetical protein
MLGQHPEMYGFPELNLFVARTVGELFQLDGLMTKVTGRQGASYTPGVTRAVAQLHFGAQTEETTRRALAWLNDRLHWSTRRMYGHFLRTVGPRIGIDKSPRTSLSSQSLRRAMEFSPGTRFLHLTRHPIATLRSMVESHEQEEVAVLSERSPGELARFSAQLWCSCQQAILQTSASFSASHFLRVRGEDLLNDPGEELLRIAHWLRIGEDPAFIELMMHPERSDYAHISPLPSDGDQDPGFLSSPLLRRAESPSSLDFPEEWYLGAEEKSAVLAIGRSLGYGSRSPGL